MTSRRVTALAGLIVLGLAAPTMAQVPMMGNLPTFDNAPAAPPPGAGAPMPGPPPMAAPPGARGGMMSGPPPGADPCEQGLVLKQSAEKNGTLVREMMEKAQRTKTPPKREEACKLFRNFAVAITRMLTFVTEHKETCRIPDQAVQGIKAGHENITRSRDQACAAGPIGGAAPSGPPPGPRLSDELGVGRIGGSGTPGRGTFDTLTGNALR